MAFPKTKTKAQGTNDLCYVFLKTKAICCLLPIPRGIDSGLCFRFADRFEVAMLFGTL
jgi:hypothetical protein